MNRYELGRAGEDVACKYLEEQGYTIIDRNLRVGHSEFDIICADEKYIVFVEVKTRNESPDAPDKYGHPTRAMTRKKCDALIRGVDQFRREYKTEGLCPRIDVISVYVSLEPTFCVRKIKHFRSAVKRRDDYR